MFTKQDYHDYFTILQKKEDEMAAFQQKCLREMTDSEVMSVLKEVLEDELRHSEIVKRLFEVLK